MVYQTSLQSEELRFAEIQMTLVHLLGILTAVDVMTSMSESHERIVWKFPECFLMYVIVLFDFLTEQNRSSISLNLP